MAFVEGNTVSVERVIAAPPEQIFDLLADPARHREIDGSGTVHDARRGAELIRARVRHVDEDGHPVFDDDEVIEFEENRRIAWQTRPVLWAEKLGRGRIWRYELEPVDGGTRVTESWDISQDRQALILKNTGMPKQAEQGMRATLERIAGLVEKG